MAWYKTPILLDIIKQYSFDKKTVYLFDDLVYKTENQWISKMSKINFL